MALFGLYLAAAALLVGAGAAKARRPGDTARAIAAALPRLPAPRAARVVRVAAAGEAALGAAALAWPARPLAASVALSYLGFTAFVLVARARGGPLATCGCFGRPDTPPTVAHALVDAAAAAAAAAVAAAAPPGWLPAVLARQAHHGWPLVLAAAVLAWFAYLVLVPATRLAALRANRP
ncbi:MAG TPA: MauE/DoxX family redox-associated membrane protein [Acidimicrobiales bacterium]|nr:MauE/DoxX family redox-associated membrane protein [Acidimicrobiales bacterium]